MKSSRKLLVLSIAAASVTGCSLFPKKDDSKIGYSFSVALESGASVIELGKTQKLVIYNNGEDTSDRSFTYQSTNPSVASVDSKGVITPKAEGRVNFSVTETKSKKKTTLKKEILVSKKANNSSGGYNFSGGTSNEELQDRAEILGKLEKYAMDTHLSGITLFENGGYVKYNPRVVIPTVADEKQAHKYIQGFGFGVLSDGELNGTLDGEEFGTHYPTFYHSAISQDSLKINMYSATGSQVSDLASYISSSYWGTKLNSTKDDYVWAPMLAMDEVRKPILDASGAITGYADSATANNDPIPVEAPNATGLYRKWRIYVKTDATFGPGLKYTKYKPGATTSGDGVADGAWHGRGVALEDYLFAYKLLLTGSDKLIRGSEMANDTSYGIKGAQRYFNETQALTKTSDIDAKWNSYINSGKLGLHADIDDVGQPYLDIELINPIDAFTAKYTLSSNLVSPLPESFFVGPDAISATKGASAKDGTLNKSAEIYGTFNNGADNAILNYTICLGPYTLTKWVKNSEIVFTTNKSSEAKWFEVGERYKIDGVYYKVVNLDTDSEKNWKHLKDHNLDSAGVPTSQIKAQIGLPNVYQTKGDSTFKLNVNSCTQAQWDKMFGTNGTINPGNSYKCKPWMSNQDFLDGLFYSIDRKAFADKRGVAPSVDYFSNAYQMRNSEGGSSYNETQAHKDAVKGYSENYGYSKDKAVNCFRNAVQQLAALGSSKGLVLGTKEKPTKINIHIKWMYQNDTKEYGEDIANYIESAFNNDAVCGGRVKLKVTQDAVTNWEEVYNEYMMKGKFDLAFGAISGNTYNPLNFLEVLKSDNSSGFTLNWGPDTSKVDEKNPIIYAPWKDSNDHSKGRQEPKKWSFDALWELADHGGIVENGQHIKPVKSCTANVPTQLDGSALRKDGANQRVLYEGFKIELPVDFAEFNQAGQKAEFDVSRLDCYIFGYGNITLRERDESVAQDENCYYDKVNKKIVVKVPASVCAEINTQIKKTNGWDSNPGTDAWHNNPFVLGQLNNLFSWELYYKLTINDGSPSINYSEVKNSDN